MPKFLVIQTAFIGDVVLATGVVEKLHRFYPEAVIDFLVRKGNESLLTGHPYLNEILTWDKQKNKFLHLLQIMRQVRKRKYDIVINIQRFAATGLLTALSGAKQKIGFDKNPVSFLFDKKIKHIISTAEFPLHEVQRNNDLISDLTEAVAEKPRLYPTDADFAVVDVYKTKPYVTISPASVWFTKQYPRERWIGFINNIPPLYTIYLLGSPADVFLADAIKNNASHPFVLNLCGKLGFLQSAALMKDAIMNYANDSAPLHFASAVNAPITAIYCSTLPSFGFGPLSDQSFIVEIPEPLYCRPCGLHGKMACPQGHFRCALDIRREQLLNTLPALRM